MQEIKAGGRRVLVPARHFPKEECFENGGLGWTAIATRITRGAARVTFVSARDPRGRPYAPVKMEISALEVHPEDPQPLPRPRNAELVLVPERHFPKETCFENGGRGWTAYAVPIARGAAQVTFVHARDSRGRPFAPVKMQLCSLRFGETAHMVPL